MNKQELISKRISANNEKFGRWHSDKVVGRACKIKILNEAPPKNELEALQHCNSLADTGNYPVGADECFNVGISGGCGLDCFVYLKGECGEPQEFNSGLSDSELARHKKLYPQLADELAT